ncbi:MAG: hypothetical protein SGJ20_00355 [Planctomycetota bacterium]|nr:hypothetical protein [Planctomycetota bacterium]
MRRPSTSTSGTAGTGWNRLVKVTDASKNSVGEFEYDEFNRRIVKIDTAAKGRGGNSTSNPQQHHNSSCEQNESNSSRSHPAG